MQIHNNSSPPTEIMTVENHEHWHEWLEQLMVHCHDSWEEDLLLYLDSLQSPNSPHMGRLFSNLSSKEFWDQFNQIVEKTKNFIISEDLVKPKSEMILSDITRAWIAGYKGLDQGCILYYGECVKEHERAHGGL